MEYTITKGMVGPEERHALLLTDDDGNILVRVLAPVGWQASRFAQARVNNTMRGMVEPVDYESVPVGCVMELAVQIAGEKLLDLAEARAALTTVRKELIAEQQKTQALASKLHLYVGALVRTMFTTEQMHREEKVHVFVPGEWSQLMTQRLYQTVDQMNPKPDNVGYLAEVIRKTGETWK